MQHMQDNLPAETNYSDGYAERLEKCYSGAVYDVLRGMSYPDQILPVTSAP